MGIFLPASGRQKATPTIERGDAGPGFGDISETMTDAQREHLGLAPQIGRTGLDKTMKELTALDIVPCLAIEQE